MLEFADDGAMKRHLVDTSKDRYRYISINVDE